MIYLTLEDLKTDSFERFITESTTDFQPALDKAEKRAIGMVKPYLKNADYNVELIFNPDAPLRNEALIEILVQIVLKKIFGRNSARKITSDVQDDYTLAMKELDKIAARKIVLDFEDLNDDGLDDANGDETKESRNIYGNNSNRNFYI